MRIRSKWLVDRDLRIHKNKFVETGDGHGEMDLGDAILMPGLVNAHCHLDYTDMRWRIAPPHGFTEWIEEITALKRSWKEEDYIQSIGVGMREALEFGTTCMGNWICVPQVMSGLIHSPMRIWWFWEQIAFRANNELPDWTNWPAQASAGSSSWHGALAPHAPYTCREEIVKKIREWSGEHGMPWSIHVGESVEENEMFTSRKGTLHDLLEKSRRPMDDCGGGTPIQWLLPQLKATTSPALLVHGNTATTGDLKLLAGVVRRSKQKISVAHCPRSRRYFSHPEFPLKEFLKRKIPVCLGTDSLASNSNLSMFEEMNLVARQWPDLDRREIVAMSTFQGAEALGVSHEKWSEWQDWIAIPCDTSDRRQIWEAISHFTGRPFFVMIDGQTIFKGSLI